MKPSHATLNIRIFCITNGWSKKTSYTSVKFHDIFLRLDQYLDSISSQQVCDRESCTSVSRIVEHTNRLQSSETFKCVYTSKLQIIHRPAYESTAAESNHQLRSNRYYLMIFCSSFSDKSFIRFPSIPVVPVSCFQMNYSVFVGNMHTHA